MVWEVLYLQINRSVEGLADAVPIKQTKTTPEATGYGNMPAKSTQEGDHDQTTSPVHLKPPPWSVLHGYLPCPIIFLVCFVSDRLSCFRITSLACQVALLTINYWSTSSVQFFFLIGRLGILYADDQEVINLSKTTKTKIFVANADAQGKDELHKAGQLYNKLDTRPWHDGATPESGIKPDSSRSSLVLQTSDPLSLYQDEPRTTAPLPSWQSMTQTNGPKNIFLGT